MAKKIKKAEPIFQWTFTGSKEIEGVKAQYTTMLRADGSTTCDCAGWIFKKKGTDDRACKHTKHISDEAKVLYKTYKSGGSLKRDDSGYGRVLELD